MGEFMREQLSRRIYRTAHQLEAGVTSQQFLNIQHDLRVTLDMLSMALSTPLGEDQSFNEAVEMVARVVVSLGNCVLEEEFQNSLDYSQTEGKRGRPSYHIPEEVLEYYVSHCFTIPQIASLIGISERTVKRRLQQYGLKITDTYSTTNDEELDSLVETIIKDHPNIGSQSVKGHLLSQGHRVQEDRIRHSLRRVDPAGVVFRRLCMRVIQRRSYSVKSSMSLWHIDGYHKLIRWRIVIHGGIDGYSRLPVYLKVANNNRAETVLAAFLSAKDRYGCPQKVRSDKGGENIMVASYMLQARGLGKGSHITGRSVHNQRIERLWREVWVGCVFLFYRLFSYMETVGLLDPSSEFDLAALHHIYLPRIQQHLDAFANALAHRPLRTEGHRSPIQLFIAGQVKNHHDTTTDHEWYGVDWMGPTPMESDNHVSIPDVDLRGDQLQQLEGIDPLQESEEHGIDLYHQAKLALVT